MNRLNHRLAQLSMVCALVMGMYAIANAQSSCAHQLDLRSLNTGQYHHNHLKLSFPEPIVLSLADLPIIFSPNREYEIILWIKHPTYEGGGISMSLSGANNAFRMIDDQALKEGIYRIPLGYDPQFTHLQIHWGEQCQAGQIELLFWGIQERGCTAFSFGEGVPQPKLWLNPDGPYGPANSLQMPQIGAEVHQWHNLAPDMLMSEQSQLGQRPRLQEAPDVLPHQSFLEFDGINDVLEVDWGGALPQSDFSQFVVFRNRNEFGTLVALTDTPLFNAPFHQSEMGFRYGHLIHRLNLNGQNTYAQSYFKVDDEHFHIGLVQVPDTSFRSLWMDGSYVGANPTNNYADFLSHILIGGQANYGYLEGDIAEIILFDQSLTTEQIEKVQTYLSFKYQIPLERNFRLANDDTLNLRMPYTNKIGSLGIDSRQLLHRTVGFSTYRDARLSVFAPEAQDGAHLLWADDGLAMELSADFGARTNNRLARSWRFWQVTDHTGQLRLRLEGFPEGLQSILIHPTDPALPNDENLIALPLEQAEDGSYQVWLKLGAHAFVSFSNERSPLLEVEWAGFDAKIEVPYLQIAWATMRERYTDEFVLERSLDGLLYQPVAKREAAFRADSVRHYLYIDQDVANIDVDRLHYRLKVIDPNGVFVYSPRLEVAVPNLKEMYLDVAVIADDQLQVNYLYRGDRVLQAKIINQKGQTVRQYQYGKGPIQANAAYDLSDLPSGIYSLRLYAGSTRKLKRFVLP